MTLTDTSALLSSRVCSVVALDHSLGREQSVIEESAEIKRVHWIQVRHNLGFRNVQCIHYFFVLVFCHSQMHQQSFYKSPSALRLAAQVRRPVRAG